MSARALVHDKYAAGRRRPRRLAGLALPVMIDLLDEVTPEAPAPNDLSVHRTPDQQGRR
jgi:hypothetical protein